MGSTFNISGQITLDTSGVAAGTKEVRSEMANLAQGGIGAFEAVQQKVIDFTKQVASLKVQLVENRAAQAQWNAQVNAAGTATLEQGKQIKGLLAEEQRLSGALGTASQQLGAAKTQMRGMTLESREASEKAQLLAAQFGVAIPSGLGKLLSRLPALGAALEAAFPVAIVGAFAVAILSSLPPVQKLIDKWHELGKASEEALKDAIAANEKLLSQPASTAQGGAFLEQTNRELAALQRKRDALEKVAFSQNLSNLLTQADIIAKVRLARVDDQIAELQKRQRAEQEGLVDVGHKELDLDAKIAAKKAELNAIRAQGIDKLRAEGQAAVQTLQFEQRGAEESKKAYFDRLIALQRAIEAAKQNQEAIKRTREQTGFLAAEDLKRASISATASQKIQLQLQEELRKIDELEKFRELSHADAEARRVAITRSATEQIKAAIDQEMRQLAALGDAANQSYQQIADAARHAENDVALKSAELYSKQRGGITGLVDVNAQASGQILAIKQRESEELIQLDRQVADARTKLQSKVFQSVEEQAAASEALEEQAARARVGIEQKAALEIALAQREAIERTAQQVESFIDRVFLQARSLSDVFHQFLTQLLGSFVKWVSRMIAESILGARQLSGAQSAAAGGGGILGSILGGIFGIPASRGTAAASGVTVGGVAGVPAIQNLALLSPGGAGGLAPAAVAAMSSSSLAALGTAPLQGGIAALPMQTALAGISPATLTSATGGILGGGMGAFPEATGAAGTKVVGGATSGILGKLAFKPAALLQSLAPMAAGLGLLGGIQLASAGSSGPVRGGIGGAIAGVSGMALLGGAIGSSVGVGFTAGMIAALTNPITAIVAGVALGVGALIGAIHRGRAKRKAASLEQGFEFAADDLYDQFKQHQIDYDSALEGMQNLIEQGRASLLGAGVGKWGQKGAENLTRVIQDEIKALQKLQKKREARGELMASMSLPEFHQGGVVGATTPYSPPYQGGEPRLHSGGVVPAAFGLAPDEVVAVLQRGEGVVSLEGMRRLGEQGLAAINRAPRFHDGGTVSPSPIPLPSRGGEPQAGWGARPLAVNVHFQAFDGPSMQSWWRRHQADIVRTIQRAVRDGA
jgi:hypothetical protein